jgi:ABC-type branched-subunit amino acid transport system substrate-binding protein
VAAAALTAASLAACGGSSSGGGSEKPILIGEIAGTTGAYGTTGQAMIHGADMAVKDLNAKGGVLGREFTLKWYNDNASATLATQQFDRLVSAGAVAITGSGDTGPAVAAQAERRRIPAIGVVDDGGLTVYPKGPGTKPYSWTFDLGLNTFAWGGKIAEYALKHCTGGLAVLHDPTTYGQGGELAIKAAYERAGKKLALDQAITENWSTGATVALTSEINKIKATGADCVDVWLTPQDQAAFAQAAHDLGAKFTIFGNDESNADNTFASLAKDRANGMVTAALTTEVQPNAQLRQFQQRYQQAYGTASTPFATATYDSIMMLAQVIKQQKSTDPRALQKGFNSVSNFPGLTGTLGFTEQKHTTIEADQLTIVIYNAGTQKWEPKS